MGFPNKATQFKPGQSGNPTGKRKRPDVDALDALIAEIGAEPGLAKVWLQKALGDKKAGIKPDFAFFKLLIEYRNGAPPKAQDDDDGGPAVPRDITIKFVNAPDPDGDRTT